MPGQKIDGTAIAKGIRESLKNAIQAVQSVNPRFKPSLTIIQVGERADSNAYVRMKLKAAAE
ncbi:tetrahydrofolate synthase, partial [Ascosphaera atra]